MQRPSSTTRNRSSGTRGVHSVAGRGLLSTGRSSSLSRMSGASQGRYSETGRGTQTKDTRPVTDKAYLMSCAERIMKFMVDCGYNTTNISARSLLNPSLKDFFGMFEFLFGYFKGQFKYVMKPEDEVPKLVKTLRYPFTINRSMLLGLGSRQTWGCLLGLLVWMIDLVDITAQGDQYFNFLEDRDGEEFGGSCYNELLFEGICERYREYVQTGLTDDDRDAEMFERCVETFVGPSNVEEMQHNNDRLREQLEGLQRKRDDLARKESFVQAGQQDIERMEQYFAKLDVYISELKEGIQRMSQEIKTIEVKIEPLQAEKSKLEAVFSQQEAEANQFKLTMAKRKATEERFNAAVMLHSQLENSLTDKEVRCCNSWHKIKKAITEYEGLYQNIQNVVKQYDDKLRGIVSPYLVDVPSGFKENVSLAEAAQALVQIQNILPVLKDQEAEASKAAITSEGTLTELREYKKELQQDESRIDSALKAEKERSKTVEQEYSQKILEIEDAIRKIDLREAERKTDIAKSLELKRKTVQDLEIKLAERKRKVEEMRKETKLVLQKAVLRIKNYDQEDKILQANIAKKVKSVISNLK